MIGVLVLLMGSMTLAAQSEFPNEIKVGDRLPIDRLNNMINYSSKTYVFSDHSPKLTILDFWGTTCGGCVAAWPKMLDFQREFGKDLQIILIDRFEEEKVVVDFINRRKKVAGVNMNLPISCNDRSLTTAFPRRTVPRYYWIDANGILVSVTHGDQVTSANIRRWITTGPFEMEQIIEDLKDVAGNTPIFVDGNGGSGRADAFIWSSTLTKAFRDIVGMFEEYHDPIRGYGICTTGTNVASLYATAFNNRLKNSDLLTFMHASRYEIIAKNPDKYLGKVNGVPNVAARYNYQLIAGNPMTRADLQAAMRQDLERYFGLDVKWEKITKKCLVITMFDSTKAHGKFMQWQNYVGETQTGLDSVTVHEAINFMEQSSFFYDNRPIVDETGFKGFLIGVRFEANCLDIKELDKGLSKFGMHIREEPREVDILTLREPELEN
jgi:thiol-disulfide isomerase/thioredoxin